jgi:O-succinylbenzoic acid--CoA ligase
MSGQRGVRPVEVPSGPRGVDLLMELLPAALAGDGPALAVAPAGDSGPAAAARAAVMPSPDVTVDDDVAVVLATSGSTGAPRGVLLPAAALLASAAATLDRVGGESAWSVALPVTSVGGLQVLVRSLLSSSEPVALASVGGASTFTPSDFAAATWRLDPSLPACTSLVPTQVARLLEDPEGLAALQSYDAVLLGGARTPPALLGRLRATHVAAMTTYGMTETSGGAVYDGVPLDGVTVAVLDADPSGIGRVAVGGAVVARGYLGDDAATTAAFLDGMHVTQDVGRLTADGLLEVLGRGDDVVQVGGVNVATSAVEDVLRELAADACVLASADETWGARLTAYVVGGAGDDALAAAVEQRLGGPAVPRAWVRLDTLPLLPNGKPDREALRAGSPGT